MSVRGLFLTVAMTAFCVPAIGAAPAPVGCPSPNILSNTLKEIGGRNWDDGISKISLRGMWPSEMGSLDCIDAACEQLQQEGKIVDGDCECCELFLFNTDRDSKGALLEERLNSIVIRYATSDKKQTVDAARNFARALGAPDSEALKISSKSRQQTFLWDIGPDDKKDVGLMEVSVGRRQQTWIAYIHFSRQPF